MIPDVANAADDALLDSLGAVAGEDVMAAATGGGSFKLLDSMSFRQDVEKLWLRVGPACCLGSEAYGLLRTIS